MAKRTRGVGVRNTHRPGGGPPVRSAASPRPTMGRAGEPPAAIPGAPPRTNPQEVALVAGAVAATETVGATSTIARTPARSTPGRVKVKPDSLLAARAKDEYVYVAKDLRQIVVVAAGLFATLIVLWLFFTIVDPFDIY